MDDSITVLGCRLCEDEQKKTQKTSKQNILKQEQGMLSVPRRKSCKEDTACASRAQISLTVADFECTSYISLDILVDTY